MTTVTYEKFFDEKTTTREGQNGRIYEGVVGWQYQVYVDGHMPDDGGRFDRLKDLKRQYPNAKKACAA